MKDNFGREIDYLRISVTDRCNLRCKYCMPDGIETMPMDEILTFEEIQKVCIQSAKLGIKNIKITGGEPLVRKGVPELVGMLKQIPGIRTVTMTTNGVFLSDHLEQLIKNGLDAVNVSLDTLDAMKYKEITGKDELHKVIKGIQQAMSAGLKVKINTVLQKDSNENEWQKIIELAYENPVDVRFIELMPIGIGRSLSGISNKAITAELERLYPSIRLDETIHGNGPAIYYNIPGFKGSIGFISAIHGKFCNSCNRIRLSATGELKPCLCYEKEIDIKHLLRNQMDERLIEILHDVILKKPEKHCFENISEITEAKKMVSIGG